MNKTQDGINQNGRWAPLRNVRLCHAAMERALGRSPNLPGFVVMAGHSGLGKSMAASYCANKFGGFYVESRSHWHRKDFAEAVLMEMGIRPERTLTKMMYQIAEQLDRSRRPLLVDEADYLVDKNVIDLLRDLHEAARTTILLIGEGDFPGKLLQRSERFHNRVLQWVSALPSQADDVKSLAQFYCPVPVAEDQLEYLRVECEGVARYICVNLDNMREAAAAEGWKKIDRATWGDRPIYSAKAAAVVPASPAARRGARRAA